MKKFLFLLAMLFIIAGLMAGVTKALPQENSKITQPKFPTRDIFYTEDFETGATGWTHYDGAVSPNDWHIYADDGSLAAPCWWMGDPDLAEPPDIGGYYNHQYLVLDTPASTITTGNSNLSFYMKLNVEGTAGATAPYDGWDSFNVRISVK